MTPMSMAMTYTISGEDNGLDYSQLRLLFKEFGDQNNITFIEAPVSESVHISFGTFKNDALIKGEVKRWNYDPLFFKQKTAIKNTLGEHYKLINKSELYDTIQKLIPNGIKYLPKSYTVKELESNWNIANYPLILKKDKVTQQKGVQMIMSKEEYYKAKKYFNIKNDAIISEYIANPLLLDGKKIHFRVYYLLSVLSGITRCIPHDEYRIYIAEEKYKKEDWLNPNIHISGVSGKTKNRRYTYPDDIASVYDINVINKKMAEFNKVMCMVMTIANAKNYPESYAGYHLYGADVLITDDFQVYLIEINDRSGFRFAENESGWEDATKQFSYRLFSFILNSTVFPFFGFVQPPIYTAEFISGGTLAPFGNILTGINKFYLIPYNTLKDVSSKMNDVNKINFYNKNLLFTNIIENCHNANIFLISGNTNHLQDHSVKNKLADIIGYIVLDNSNYLSVVIMEEYQNRGIATAMVAQLLDILYARHYTESHHQKVYINKNNIFMIKIARKLSFTLNKNNEYEIGYKLLKNHVIQAKNKFNLTYRIIYGEPNIKINFEIDQNMTTSYSQFVNFVYNFISGTINKKHSTGNRHDKDFIYQGAELKSVLNIPILFNIFKIHVWVRTNFLNNQQIFDKIIKSESEIILDQKYVIFDINKQYKKILNSNELKTEFYDIKNYIIYEYYPPHLLDDKLVAIRYYFLIYNSGNGVLKFFIFPKSHILTTKNEYNEKDLNGIETNLVYCNTTLKKYTISDIFSNIDAKNIDAKNIDIITNFFELISQYDIKPYPESNAGFNECILDIKFLHKNKNITPVIHKVFNWVGVQKNNIIDDHFVKEYYHWMRDCVILPHFGIANHKYIKPHYGTLSKYIQYSSKIKYSILENIHLEFNHDRTEVIIMKSSNRMQSMQSIGRIKSMQSIGRIKLHIKQNEIYVVTMPELVNNNEDIAINIIFILMDILRAYYAPIQMSLLLKYEKKNDSIAFELEFAKKDNYYIHKC
jgi:GNAT superfamily N-acetyltransferase